MRPQQHIQNNVDDKQKYTNTNTQAKPVWTSSAEFSLTVAPCQTTWGAWGWQCDVRLVMTFFSSGEGLWNLPWWGWDRVTSPGRCFSKQAKPPPGKGWGKRIWCKNLLLFPLQMNFVTHMLAGSCLSVTDAFQRFSQGFHWVFNKYYTIIPFIF